MWYLPKGPKSCATFQWVTDCHSVRSARNRQSRSAHRFVGSGPESVPVSAPDIDSSRNDRKSEFESLASDSGSVITWDRTQCQTQKKNSITIRTDMNFKAVAVRWLISNSTIQKNEIDFSFRNGFFKFKASDSIDWRDSRLSLIFESRLTNRLTASESTRTTHLATKRRINWSAISLEKIFVLKYR